ncbi:hypothetical protein LTR09_004462 [Extremus antarcticus]|uniref:Mitochondrial ribosomal protein subunit L20 n=1 Tax=Extremus antarcticus TaxID=702011 RepID=A0AAJ0DIX9_9PEZI|nr:hypothetical protein LTR09_004462 [Extremus antarcticus]
MAPSIFSTLLRPSALSTDSVNFICAACRCNASSFRRTRKALRVKPDAAFLPSKTEPQDHIIFNPPSSAPNVYHTPSKFLPATDPRRKLHTLAPAPRETPTTSPLDSAPSSSYEKKYHLGKEEMEEIRRLRAEDPKQWTRVNLAEKFECSQFFISLCCSAPTVKKEQDKQLEAIKKRWGRRKTEAREGRQARKQLWGRDA